MAFPSGWLFEKHSQTVHSQILVEEFVRGREFNVALFGYPEAQVLPLAEIDFGDFPAGLHRIVGYRAKWAVTSFEYLHTPRRFPADLPGALQADMGRLALDCFRLFGLRDYGRVDLRLDAAGRPYILEINANPCLSPDAGFAAAVAQSNRTYPAMIREFLRILTMRVCR